MSSLSPGTPRPLLVTATSWSVSYSMPLGSPPDGPGTLHVTDLLHAPSGLVTGVVHHPEHDGRTFASRDLKDAYCLEHGLLTVYVPSEHLKEI